jgi:GTP-binding protein Era
MIKVMSKSAMVAIVGRPSAGKSTLMNALCGEKISIVTPVPQTTRNRVRGILNDESGQIVFLDTPGFHHSEKKFNQQLMTLVSESLEDCDLVLYLIDASRRPGAEERELISIIAKVSVPVLLVVNKIDAADAAAAAAVEEQVVQAAGEPFAAIRRVSATRSDGLEELKTELFRLAPDGEAMYPEDYYTDQDPEFRIAEIIRERAMLRAREELPHAMYVEIHDLEIRDSADGGNDGRQLWVRASVNVENKSQVGLVVGKGGVGIKAIRTESQKEIGRLFPYRVHLDLRVKVSPKWRRNDGLIRRIVN